jgi:hypothetical protein
MPFYPGDPVPRLEKTASIKQSGFNVYCLCSSLHVGTHMDAPLHMIEDGARVSDVHLPRFFGRGRLVDARGRTRVTSDLLDDLSLEQGDIVAVLTGWYKRFRGPDYYTSFPEIAPDFATRIADAVSPSSPWTLAVLIADHQRHRPARRRSSTGDEAAALPRPFHPDLGQLYQPGRALVPPSSDSVVPDSTRASLVTGFGHSPGAS